MLAVASVLSLLLFAAVVSLWVRSHWRHDHRGKAVQTHVDRGLQTLDQFFVESSAGGIAMGRRAGRFDSHGMSGVMVWVAPRGVTRYSRPPRGYPSLPQWSYPSSPPSRPPWWTRLGFHYLREVGDNGAWTTNNWAVVIPYWSLAALTSVLPASWWLSSRKRRRQAARIRRGLCPGCGYDLRGSPDRCPECGRPAARPQTLYV